MTRIADGVRLLALGAALTASAVACPSSASAHVRHAGAAHGYRGHVRFVHAYYGGGLQCVPYARNVSGIEIGGNAWTWWDQAAGVYERGARPEPGSVLAFTANGRMRLGHVAVVTDVAGPREITIDHANWTGRGGVSHGMTVVDVSEANDWTAVRLQQGADGQFGSVYPTHGFIYDRPDHGVMVAAADSASPAPALNPPPSDLRPRVAADDDEEVAELPEHGRHYRMHAGLSHRHGARHAALRRRGVGAG